MDPMETHFFIGLPYYEELHIQLMQYSNFSRLEKIQNLNSSKNSTVHAATFDVRIFVGVVELLVFAIGTPANLLVLYLTYEIYRSRHRRGSDNSENHQIQNGQLFVLAMILFDLLFCLGHAPMMFTMFVLVDWLPLTYVACIITYFITHASTTGSSLSLLALNVEKFIRLYKPLHYRTIVTRRRSITVFVSIWIVSCSWSIFLMFGPFMTNAVSPKGQCIQKLKHPAIYGFFAFKFFVLPTLVSLAISIFTLLAALRIHRRRSSSLKETTGLTRGSQNSRETPLGNAESRMHVAKQNGADQKNPYLKFMALIGFVFTTTMWTSGTTLPYRIGYLSTITYSKPSHGYITFMFIIFSLMVLNAAGNPFITIVTKRQYFLRAKKMIAIRGSATNWSVNRRSTRMSEQSARSTGGKRSEVYEN